MNLSLIIITVSVFWVGSEIILARTKRSQSIDIRFDQFSLCILWITITLSVSIGVLSGFQRVGYFGNGSRIFPTTGLILIVCGLLVRWTAIVSLKHQFTVDVSITKEQRIIKKGIYRFVRHPAYAGSLLSFFGLGLFFANYLSMLIIIVPDMFSFPL